MIVPAEGHFALNDLAEELARATRRWRRLWFATGVIGVGAASIGVALLWNVWRTGPARLVDWWGPSLLVACLLPSILAFWEIRTHSFPPIEAWISREEVSLRWRGGRTVGFRWAGFPHRLVICDLRPTAAIWLESGARRTIDFIVLGIPGAVRIPMPHDAVARLVSAATSNGWSVRRLPDTITRQGEVHRDLLLPPSR